MVTLNYRLGPLGFLSFGNSPVSPVTGNMGLRDQQMALAWVRDHIAQFNGDPGRVTVFGGDAGGVSAQAHLVSPRSSGLLAGAISQSGGLLASHLSTEGQEVGLERNPDHLSQAQLSKLLGDSLGCGTANDRDMLECLQVRSPTRRHVAVQGVEVQEIVQTTMIKYENNNPADEPLVSRNPSEGPFLFWWPVSKETVQFYF